MYMIVLFVHWSTPSTFMKKGHYSLSLLDNDSLLYGTLYYRSIVILYFCTAYWIIVLVYYRRTLVL
jgi:hypothetical protein